MISKTMQQRFARVRLEAGNRCGYCLSPQHLVLGQLEIEHLIPRSRGGSDNKQNLWLSCRLCNDFKASQISAFDPETKQITPIFNPRAQFWNEHFAWIDGGKRIHGNTPTGRATVIALQMNNLIAITVRENWIAAGWHPPTTTC